MFICDSCEALVEVADVVVGSVCLVADSLSCLCFYKYLWIWVGFAVDVEVVDVSPEHWLKDNVQIEGLVGGGPITIIVFEVVDAEGLSTVDCSIHYAHVAVKSRDFAGVG